VIRAVIAVIGVTVLALVPGVVAPAAADASQSVRTESGRVRCIVTSNDVGHGGGPMVTCQTSAPDNRGFPQAPASDTAGFHWDMASVTDTGAFNWNDGNIPGNAEALASDIVLNYGQTYHVSGWTILPTFDGTRFTNDQSGHGMSVSIDNVSAF
jgi:hypothetical protein